MNHKSLSGTLLDEQAELSLTDLSKACCSSAEWIIELVEEGALDPISNKAHSTQYTQWRFSANSLRKAQTAMRLQRDLNINLAGIALALELLQRVEELEAQVRIFNR